MTQIIIRSYRVNLRLHGDKTFIGFMEIEDVGKTLPAKGISILKRHSTAALEMKYERTYSQFSIRYYSIKRRNVKTVIEQY